MRRYAGYVLIFALGVGVGMALLRTLKPRPLNLTQARTQALQVLEQAPNVRKVGDNPIVQAVKRIEPAVVNIDTVGETSPEEESGFSWGFRREVRGKGSGVILTSDGYIVTNYHVIEGAKRIRVTLADGRWHYAKLVGRDPQTDLAVVRIEERNLPSAELGDSNALQVGEWTIAVGNPLGLGSTVTVGVISALNRRNLQLDEGRKLEGAIQTDAAMNRGNSGGALANMHGQLVGINTAILSSEPNGGNIGLGFAIPINTVRRVVRELIVSGKTTAQAIRRPWLGVRFDAVPNDLIAQFRLGEAAGVQIKAVIPNSPAAQAGVLLDDIILAVDGKPIGEARDLLEAVGQRHPGERALLRILRPADGSEREVPLTMRERPSQFE